MVRVSFYDWILIGIGIVSSNIMALMLIGQFSAIGVLATSMGMLALIGLVLNKFGVSTKRDNPDLWLIAIIALGLFLRSNFSTNYIGGNDSGLYVAFSGIIEHFGGMYAPDNLRSTLPSDLRDLYDRVQMAGMLPIGDGSKFYAVFYPLHPGWMALFSSLFGADAHGLSVLMFSLLGITGAYHLTLALSDDTLAARLAALFMAVNPALCYLGKLPFTEAQSTALLLNGAYLLVRAVQGQRPQLLLFATSLLLLTMFIFTRLNFAIMVVPWGALYVLSHSGRLENGIALRLRGFLWCLVASIATALVVYWIALPFLFQSIIIDFYIAFLRRHTFLGIALAMAAVGMLLFEIFPAFRSRLMPIFRLSVVSTERYAYWIPLVAIVASLWSLVALTKAGASFYGMEIAPAADNFRLHIVYRLAVVITPFLIALLIFLPRFGNKRIPVLTIPCLFLASTLLLTAAYTPALPYLWYHGRYLASEVVPFAIVILSIVLATMLRTSRVAAVAIVAPSLAMMLVLSSIELNAKEAEEPEFFHELDRAIGPSDVVIADENEFNVRYPVPLRFYFNKQLFVLPKDAAPSDHDRVVRYFLERSGKTVGRVFLISQDAAIPAEKTLERTVHYRERRLVEPNKVRFLPPIRWISNDITFHLYRITGASP